MREFFFNFNFIMKNFFFMLSFGIDMRSFKYDLWWYLSEVEEFFMAHGEIFNAFQGKFIWMNFSAVSNDDGKLIFIQVQGCLKYSWKILAIKMWTLFTEQNSKSLAVEFYLKFIATSKNKA